MNCPRDGANLVEMEIDGVVVDVCESCGGVWFDNFEIKKFDEVHEDSGDRIIALMEKHRNLSIDLSARVHCPKCQDIVMMRRFHSPAQAIEIDECPGCAGIWLDGGELAQIRDLYPTEADREKAGKEFLNSVLEPQFKEMRAQGAEEEQKAKRFANMFRFICPSHYIPGKQAGGAF